MKKLLVILLLFPAFSYATNIKKITFFKNTQFPLTAFFLKGEQPGPTIMVQGGIQGDEICGVLTAQSLLGSRLIKGNLIVVPRANVLSILLRKRGINVDLNRRFDKNYRKFYEDHLAEAIKFLVSLSNGLIHLHEGSGFYSPIFISELRNPKRYGQSFIIDTSKYKEKIFLEGTVRPILNGLNSKILNKDYWFKIFNTNTLSPFTKYPEQRKSLTYYTLTKLGLPAFAIEVSKDIKDLKWKTTIQLHATQMVLKRLGVTIEIPDKPTYLPPKSIPEDLRIYLDGKDITNKQKITINAFSHFSVTMPRLSPHKSMEFGIFSPEVPGINFLKRNYVFSFKKIRRFYFSIDGEKVKIWKVHLSPPIINISPYHQDIFICQLNNKILFIPEGETIVANEGDKLILFGLLNGCGKEILNLKGYISRSGPNTGQDLNSEIILDKNYFLKNYIQPIKDSKGWMCEVVREDNSKKISKFKIIVLPKKLSVIKLTRGTREYLIVVGSNLQWKLPQGKYKIGLIEQSGMCDNLIFFANGFPIKLGENIELKKGKKIVLKVIDTTLLRNRGEITLKAL